MATIKTTACHPERAAGFECHPERGA